MQNTDVTNEEVLAAETGRSRAEFLEAFCGEEARQKTWTDFAITQQAGVRGFPFLIAGTDEQAQYSVVTHDFQRAERILATLERWLEMVRQREVAAPDEVPV